MTRVRVGRKMVPLGEATLSQLQIAALKAFPSSPYQLEIRKEINRRHERGEKTWMPPEKKRRRNPELKDVRAVGSNMTEAHHGLLHILYSYKTPVAILAPSGIYKTDKFHSRTTSGHIAKWIRSWNLDPKGAGEIGQDEIERCAQDGIDPQKVVRSRNAPRRVGKRELSVFDRHQLKIAQDTLKMNDAMARVMGGPTKAEAREIIKRLTGKAPRENPRRRSVKTKKIATSYLRKRYEFFRKPSVAGIQIEHPASAEKAKALADAERWAYDNDVDFRYYYGADAGEEEQWRGRIEAVHPDGTTGEAYGYLGDDWNQAHVKAGAALALMVAHGGRRKGSRRAKNPKRGKVVRVRKRRVVLRRNGKGRMVRRSNPVIGVLGNPPADAKYLGKVTYIEYTHGHDGQRYYHDFKPAVYAQVTDDGRVMLWHPTNNLWKLFPMN